MYASVHYRATSVWDVGEPKNRSSTGHVILTNNGRKLWMYLDERETAELVMKLVQENRDLSGLVNTYKDQQIKELESTIKTLRSEVSAKDKLHSAKVQVLNDKIDELEEKLNDARRNSTPSN